MEIRIVQVCVLATLSRDVFEIPIEKQLGLHVRKREGLWKIGGELLLTDVLVGKNRTLKSTKDLDSDKISERF
jgi:hypothetical protein